MIGAILNSSEQVKQIQPLPQQAEVVQKIAITEFELVQPPKEPATSYKAAKASQPIQVATPGSKTQWMKDAGIKESDYQYVQAILGQESGWTLEVTNSIGCIGLGQACPSGNKAEMLTRCPNWATDGACQMRVWNDYAIRRYGSWAYANEWKFCTGHCYNAHTGATVNKHGEPWW